CPTCSVSTTSMLSESMTVTVLSPSFETKILYAKAGAGAVSAVARSSARAVLFIIPSLPLIRETGGVSLPPLQAAFRFRPVVAERVEHGRLVQETVLRRHGNDVAAVGEQHRLPELQVPVAQRQLLA